MSRANKGPPCPHCRQPISQRAMARIQRRVKRETLGPNRAAALMETGDGFCAMCDLPIREVGKGRKGVYTCGRKVCVNAWGALCREDWIERRKAKKCA